MRRCPILSLPWESVLLLLAALTGCVPEPRAFRAGSLEGTRRVAILPPSNYSPDRDAPDKVRLMLAASLGQQPGLHLVDPGAVEAALAQEPWLLFDRIPPDLLDRLGEQLGAEALLVGAILGCGYRQDGADRVPHFSFSLRLLQTPGGRLLWSVVHSRDGDDGEWLFDFGRVHDLEQLIEITIEESLRTFPVSASGTGSTPTETGSAAKTTGDKR